MPDGSSTLLQRQPQTGIAEEALTGLRQEHKVLPAKLFYDAEGCRLFEQITGLPEYYPTRTERALLEHRGAAIAAVLRPLAEGGTELVEYGACTEAKAAILLRALAAGGCDPAVYVPIDVAESALEAIVARLRESHPRLAVRPVVADFMSALTLPIPESRGRLRLGFFPGSTIGNLEPASAQAFLRHAAATLGPGARFLVGVDLRKDPAILVPAYDDAEGVTAAFNRNILARLNREAGADFDLPGFVHRAVWNDAESRIEMHLVSRRAQLVRLGGETIRFADGETIHTESSYKHTVDGFRALAAAAGWRPSEVWTDAAGLFSLHLLAAGESP